MPAKSTKRKKIELTTEQIEVDEKTIKYPVRCKFYEGEYWYAKDRYWKSTAHYKEQKTLNLSMEVKFQEAGYANPKAAWEFAKKRAHGEFWEHYPHFTGICFRNKFLNAIGEMEDLNNNFPKFSTTQIPVCYSKNSEPDPIFMKYFHSASGNNPEWEKKMLMLLSTCLSNDNFNVLALFYGIAGNGKSFLTDLIQEGVGDLNYSKLKSRTIFGNNEYEFAQGSSDNKSVIIFDESPETFTKKGCNIIKSLADVGRQQYSKKHSRESTFRNGATYLLNSNFIPKMEFIDQAIKERFVMFEFKNKRDELAKAEWTYLMKNKKKIFISLLPTLIEHYKMVLASRDYRAYRFAFLPDCEKLWKETAKLNPVKLWLDGINWHEGAENEESNAESCIGKDIHRIYTNFYNSAIGRSTKIDVVSFLREIERLGWESKKELRPNGAYKYCYYPPKK